jgi:hypothetical protein
MGRGRLVGGGQVGPQHRLAQLVDLSAVGVLPPQGRGGEHIVGTGVHRVVELDLVEGGDGVPGADLAGISKNVRA